MAIMPLRSIMPGAVLDWARRAGADRLLPAGGPRAPGDVLEPSIYRFVLRYSMREQIYLVIVTLLSFPVLYYSLELPKQIINQAIAGKSFPEHFIGIELGQIEYLILLCSVFLALVLVNGAFKYHLNVRK